jgi:hypothetical protein
MSAGAPQAKDFLVIGFQESESLPPSAATIYLRITYEKKSRIAVDDIGLARFAEP